MSVVTLTINGELVSAREGETLLEVMREQHIAIPTLCHLEGLSDRGACRLCMVEVEGSNKLFAACVTPVQEGMVVKTHTPRLIEYRKMILELLFAERNHVCAVCVANGACELQDLATSLGVDHVRVRYRHPQCEVDLSHPRFGLDHNRCILCSRCVRVCDEVEGAHNWDIGHRGTNARVISDFGTAWGDSESCTSCGKCVQVCPTGALFSKGASVGEMRKDRSFLKYIVTAREKHQWIR